MCWETSDKITFSAFASILQSERINDLGPSTFQIDLQHSNMYNSNEWP